jgi:hypothetical protein
VDHGNGGGGRMTGISQSRAGALHGKSGIETSGHRSWELGWD